MRLGVIGSSGGSALASADECLIDGGKNIEWVVVTDRQCGLESWATASGYKVHRLDYDNAESFSKKASLVFRDAGCEDIVLFYTRRLTYPLIDQMRIWNIHPSILPAYPGLHAVRQAFNSGARFIGATLHRVDEGLDTGQIVAQVVAPLTEQTTYTQVEHISYLQKVWLVLVWVDILCGEPGQPISFQLGNSVAVACPGIADQRLYISYINWLGRSCESDGRS